MMRYIVTSIPFLVCLLMISCASVPPPSEEEMLLLQRARADLSHGEYDWTLHDMEIYLDRHPKSPLSATAHLIAGDAAKGQVDRARKEKRMTGMVLTSFTAPLVQKAYENYLAAANLARNKPLAAEAMYKAAVILDIQYMKQFEAALVMYERIMKEYPEMDQTEEAQKRYQNLSGKFRNLETGPHNIPAW
jgi:outer membrane protein assembly factor BamD (BamD/ComL family)